jgi:hypothetical protein
LGALRSQTLNISFTGILMFIPPTLALTTAQRHTTASTSARPSMREQQGSDCGEPTTTFAKSFNRLAQTRKLGQIGGGGGDCDTVGDGGGGGGDGDTVGDGGGDGDTFGAWAELRVVKKKMLRERMRIVMDATLFEPILK